MDRRERRLNRAFGRVSADTAALQRELAELQLREARLEAEVASLRQRVEVREDRPAEPTAHVERAERPGPVIHVYLANGQDFYGVVNGMDDESFSIAVSNSAGRVVVIPKKNILYYRMKY